MQKALLLKLVFIGLTALALLVPLRMIESLIAERAGRRAEAVASVQASLAGAQTVVTPLIAWPYIEEWPQISTDPATRERRTETQRREDRLLIFANAADTDAVVKVVLDRHRGLHEVRTYEATIKSTLAFSLAARNGVQPKNPNGRLIWQAPVLIWGIHDVRGMRGATQISIDGTALDLAQGSREVLAQHGGVHAVLPLPRGDRVTVDALLQLVGIERLGFVPTAARDTVNLKSDWPHPSFSGRFLPLDKQVQADGFGARWSISALTSSAQQAIGESKPVHVEAFTVDFLEPVNVYLLAERATKYGAPFVALVIAAVFLLETLRRLPVHPIQYGLVGLALALFFLLLLSLSEHLAFGLSYLIAAAGCGALISIYLGYALRSARIAVVLALVLAVVYGALYGVLIAETLSLLMGAALLFAVLATFMLATRKIDWYRLTPASVAAQT